MLHNNHSNTEPSHLAPASVNAKVQQRLEQAIERKEYQKMLLNGALAFGSPADDSEFSQEFVDAHQSRKKFAVMVMSEDDPNIIEQQLLYMFQAEDFICSKVSSSLTGLASGYLIMLWRSVNDELLKSKLAQGLSSLREKNMIDDEQLFSPQDFPGDGSTLPALREMLSSVDH